MSLNDSSWAAAIRDSGASASKVSLVRLEGEPVGGPTEAWASWIPPGERADRSGLFPLSDSQIEEANEAATIQGFRVIAFTGGEEALVYGLVRHELEHVCQYAEYPPSLWLSQRTVESFDLALPHLPGSGRIYNLMPRELDANAAARLAIAERYPHRLAPLSEGIHSALATGTHVPDRETLFFRTFCFAYLFRESLDLVLGKLGDSLESFAAAFHADFRKALRELEGDADLTKTIKAAEEQLPGQREVGASGDRPGDAWNQAAESYTAAYVRAAGLLGMQL